MMSWDDGVRASELREVLAALDRHLALMEDELPTHGFDFYWEFAPETKYDPMADLDDPKLFSGSLSEDWEWLLSVSRNDEFAGTVFLQNLARVLLALARTPDP